MHGLSLRVGGSGLVRWVSYRIRVSKSGRFHVYSGNVHARASSCTTIILCIASLALMHTCDQALQALHYSYPCFL